MAQKTDFKIISIDNYSTGSKKNHIKDKRVNYVIGDTKNIFNIPNAEIVKYEKEYNEKEAKPNSGVI